MTIQVLYRVGDHQGIEFTLHWEYRPQVGDGLCLRNIRDVHGDVIPIVSGKVESVTWLDAARVRLVVRG